MRPMSYRSQTKGEPATERGRQALRRKREMQRHPRMLCKTESGANLGDDECWIMAQEF